MQPFEILISRSDLLKFERYEQGFLLLTDLNVDAASDEIDPGFACISRLLRVSSNNLIIGTIFVERKLLRGEIAVFLLSL